VTERYSAPGVAAGTAQDAAARVRSDVARFFAPSRWRTPLPEFEHSGYALVDTVRALAPRFVVDVGCGDNLFKGRIPNLLGIDLVNPAADLVCDLFDAPVRAGSIDVVLALGCINFGPREVIERQLRWVAGWLTPAGRIIMRGNPGRPIGPGLECFAWSADNLDTIGTAAGLRRDGPVEYDTFRNRAGVDEPRLVWHYRLAATDPGPCG
jgi:hypothetical protein